MNDLRCVICNRSQTTMIEVHWDNDGSVEFLCPDDAPRRDDPRVLLWKELQYWWMTEADV